MAAAGAEALHAPISAAQSPPLLLSPAAGSSQTESPEQAAELASSSPTVSSPANFENVTNIVLPAGFLPSTDFLAPILVPQGMSDVTAPIQTPALQLGAPSAVAPQSIAVSTPPVAEDAETSLQPAVTAPAAITGAGLYIQPTEPAALLHPSSGTTIEEPSILAHPTRADVPMPSWSYILPSVQPPHAEAAPAALRSPMPAMPTKLAPLTSALVPAAADRHLSPTMQPALLLPSQHAPAPQQGMQSPQPVTAPGMPHGRCARNI